MNHVIWTGRQILKLASNFEIGVKFWNLRQMSICLFTFLFFAWSKRRRNCSASFWWNHPTFSISWKSPTIHFTTTLKKHNDENLSIFNIQCPVQMTLSTPKSKFIWCIWIKIMVAFVSQTGHIIFCWNVLIRNIDNWSQPSFRVLTQHVHYFVSICFPTNFKGQLISKCPFGVFISSKKNTNYF